MTQAPKTSPESPLDATKQKALDVLFENLPGDFSGRYEALKALHVAFHKKVAGALEPVLNEHIRQQPPTENSHARRSLSAWVDRITRDVGVTLADPNTGKPALLIVEHERTFQPNSPTQFTLLRPSRGGIARIDVEKSLTDMHLALIPAPGNIESLFEDFRQSQNNRRR